MNTRIYKMKSEWEKNTNRYKSWIGMTGRRPDEKEFKATVKDIKSKFDISSGLIKTFLDVGCNNGYLLHSLEIKASIKVGVDFCFPPLSAGKKEFKDIYFIQSESSQLPFKSEEFDRVLCYNMFHYLPSEEFGLAVCKELYRVLKEHGILLIGDLFTKEHKHLIPKDDYDRWNSKSRPYMHRIENWLFISIEQMKSMFIQMGANAIILEQSSDVRCPGYRLDLLVEKRGTLS